MLERLQKIIARAGIASRRHAEELISSGMVTVNGRAITELGSKADESRDHIKVSGKLLRPASERVYLLLNKPAEVVSTMSDPEGRRSLRDFLHGVSERVFPVGRLEYHSSGLVFLTNDGELANRVLQSHQLRQTYHLKLKSLLTFEEIEKLSRSTGARISRLRGAEMPWYEVTLAEARSDALRNKLFQFGHPVEKIKRVAIGNLSLDSLGAGHRRELSSAEVASLSKLLDGNATENSAAAKKHPVPRSKRRPEYSNQNPRGKSGGKPGGKPGAKWGGKPNQKPNQKPGEKPNRKSNYSRERRLDQANRKGKPNAKSNSSRKR
jgi:23S rRNA pseudouridine2605 synthase